MADPADNANTEPPAAPKRTGPQPNWMASGGPAPVGRGKALFVGMLLIVAIAGALVGVLLIPAVPVNAYLVSLPLSIYDDTALPPVAYAEQDTKLLVDCLPKNAENAYTAGELVPLRNKLKAIAEGNIRLEPGESNAKKLEEGQPFIFHVVGHAAVADDAVHLLPLKADLDNPKSWLPLQELLDALGQCPTTKKLLLLDLGRPRANAFLGPLADDATAKLHEWLGKQREKLPCPVIVSCSPGEESLVIPQVGASAFAFYAAEGLRGAADGYGTPAPDKKVKVKELAEFVRVRTARWARQNRDVPQMTKLFEPADFQDFDLMLDVPAPVVEDPEPLKRPFAAIGVAEGWTARADLPADAARRAGPQLARWAVAALRAEQLYAANPADSRVADAARGAARWWDEVRTGTRPTDALAYRTLASVAIPSPAPMADPAVALRAALDRYAAVALPDAKAKVDDKDVTDRKAAFDTAAAGLPPAVAGKVVWTWLLERFPDNAQPPARDLAFAAATLQSALKADPELYVEAVALGRIIGLDVPPFERPEARATIMKFLRLEAASGLALRNGSVGFEWVAPLAAAADDAKLQAEQMLFRATSRAEVELADAAIVAATAKWTDVGDRLAALAAARDAAADGARVVVGTALAHAEFDWPISLEKDAATFKDWTDLAGRTTALANELSSKPAGPWETAGLKRATRDVADLAAKIAREADAAAAKRFVDGAASARPADLRRYRALLQTSLLAGADRAKVWDAAEAIAERLHLATRKDADLLDNEARTVTKPPTLPAPLPAGRFRRADVAVRLLELGGHPAGAKLHAALDDLRRVESPEKWRTFTAELRAAWNRAALVQRLAETAPPDPDRLDRLARALPPGLWQDTPDKPTVGDWRDAPARKRNRDELAWRAWLAAHYRKYATARTDVPNAAERYQKAAQDADRKPRD